MALRFATWITGAVLAVALGACAPAPPPEPEPTIAQVNITGAADQNPDKNGRASPAVVHIYAMKTGAPFDIGDPDALIGGEMGELGETMTRLARLVIVPGGESKKVFELGDDFTDIGITVAYRNFDQSQWRVMAPVKTKDVTLIKATVGAAAVTVQ
ncbi:MAG: type VI secretion system lipoprotein TssJ [Pseudomonadota bacterium]